METQEEIKEDRWFSVKDEEALVAALDVFALLNRPLDKSTFLGMVRDMVPDDEWDPRT